jgi:hypothetical protein
MQASKRVTSTSRSINHAELALNRLIYPAESDHIFSCLIDVDRNFRSKCGKYGGAGDIYRYRVSEFQGGDFIGTHLG